MFEGGEQPTLTELAANISIKLAQVPFKAGIDAATEIIRILTGVKSRMDISRATKELQTRLDTLAGAMKNQSTQLKTGETAADFMELLAAAIKAANEVGSNIGPPLADEAQKIINSLFKFGKSTAADLIGLIPVVGEVFDVLRIINSVVSTTISSVDSFVTSADLLMNGFDDFVEKMSEVDGTKLLTQKNYKELLESNNFKKKFEKKFTGQKPPDDLQTLQENKDKKSYVVKFLQAKKQFTEDLHNSKSRRELLQGYANKRLQYHTKNISSLKKQVESKGVVPLVTQKTTSGLREVHTKVSSAAAEHYKSLQEAIKKRSTERQERQAEK